MGLTNQNLEELMEENKVKDIFSSIAGRYDLLNEILSFRRDRYWRRLAVMALLDSGGKRYLDMATGTADIALKIASQSKNGVEITGVDLTFEMLTLGKKKVIRAGAADSIRLAAADAHTLPFADNIFDGAIVAFGVRNFTNLAAGLTEMGRVIRQGGKLVILEFSHPTDPVIKEIYRLYSRHILPIIGGLISGDRRAYTYLPESVRTFPDKDRLKEIIEGAGFRDVSHRSLTFGVVAIHSAFKE